MVFFSMGERRTMENRVQVMTPPMFRFTPQTPTVPSRRRHRLKQPRQCAFGRISGGRGATRRGDALLFRYGVMETTVAMMLSIPGRMVFKKYRSIDIYSIHRVTSRRFYVDIHGTRPSRRRPPAGVRPLPWGEGGAALDYFFVCEVPPAAGLCPSPSCDSSSFVFPMRHYSLSIVETDMIGFDWSDMRRRVVSLMHRTKKAETGRHDLSIR